MRLRKVLAEKVGRGHDPLYQVDAAASLRDAARMMCGKGVGAVLVEGDKDGGGRGFVGVLSERDILKACAAGGDLDAMKVSAVMSHEIVVARLDDDVKHVIDLMGGKHIRHVPLVDDQGVMVGFLSVRDLIRSVMAEDELRIQHLSDYLGVNSHSAVY